MLFLFNVSHKALLVAPVSLHRQWRPQVTTTEKPQDSKHKAIKMEAMKCGEVERVHCRGSSEQHAHSGEIKEAEI